MKKWLVTIGFNIYTTCEIEAAHAWMVKSVGLSQHGLKTNVSHEPLLPLDYFRMKLRKARRLIWDIEDKLCTDGTDGEDRIRSIKDAIAKYKQIYGMESYRTINIGRGLQKRRITNLCPLRYMIP